MKMFIQLFAITLLATVAYSQVPNQIPRSSRAIGDFLRFKARLLEQMADTLDVAIRGTAQAPFGQQNYQRNFNGGTASPSNINYSGVPSLISAYPYAYSGQPTFTGYPNLLSSTVSYGNYLPPPLPDYSTITVAEESDSANTSSTDQNSVTPDEVGENIVAASIPNEIDLTTSNNFETKND